MPTIAFPGYDVLVASDALDRTGDIARHVADAHRFAIITDDAVGPLYADRVTRSFGANRVSTLTLPAGEAHKTRESWMRITDELLASGHGRDTTIIALGGGVVGDLAGFVAATFMRGVPVVQVPTTLLAMIDAALGGKTAVDTPHGKNLVGAYHRPSAVVADPNVLTTLPIRLLRAGLAEAIKHGAIADAAYLERITSALPAVMRDTAGAEMYDLIVRSIEIKASVVERDEHESGVRKILNFGHTLGHAIEAESGYELLHGEAVAIGMVLESALAERVGVASGGTAGRLRDIVARAELPTTRPAALGAARILAATGSDKKSRRGIVEYALPARLGAMAGEASGWAIPVSDADVLAVLS
ncbi:MAG TPA: 3-dehydroquinate synthase [Gemmatimonadaceae bacterium]|nr:3-dehydroquinate synthase [Gemmatimonadaceae bacterium]